ncbi:MAG: MmcQ/YjbR family DNA-binding protein [Ruegeria sp.]
MAIVTRLPVSSGSVTLRPMTRDEFNAFCATLKATSHVVQWGNADVWKVGGKVFAICGWNDGKDAFTFKATDLAYEVLQDQPGIRPAPYLASRGMKWLQVYDERGMSDASLRDHIVTSYEMVVAKLTKKMRAELGL